MEPRPVLEMAPLQKIAQDFHQDNPHGEAHLWAWLRLDWFGLPSESAKATQREVYIKIEEMYTRRINADVGFRKVLVGWFSGLTRDGEWKITVTVARTSFNEYRATYVRCHPDQP